MLACGYQWLEASIRCVWCSVWLGFWNECDAAFGKEVREACEKEGLDNSSGAGAADEGPTSHPTL